MSNPAQRRGRSCHLCLLTDGLLPRLAELQREIRHIFRYSPPPAHADAARRLLQAWSAEQDLASSA